MAQTADFQIVNHGSLVGFQPLTEAATEWWDENVADGPCLGFVRFVEHRFADDIADGIAAAGLTY